MPLIIIDKASYHDFNLTAKHKSQMNRVPARKISKRAEEKVFSSRIRVARNLSNFSFPSSMTYLERKESLKVIKVNSILYNV